MALCIIILSEFQIFFHHLISFPNLTGCDNYSAFIDDTYTALKESHFNNTFLLAPDINIPHSSSYTICLTLALFFYLKVPEMNF